MLTRAPALVSRVPIPFPEAARAAQRSGDVVMTLVLDATGHVTEVTVTQPAGFGFDEAAVAAVKQFVFSAAQIDGQPAAVEIAYTEHFVYAPPVAPAAPSKVPLTGRILERASRNPVAGAAVIVSADGVAQTPAVTAADGTFSIDVAPGPVVVDVKDIAHRPFHAQESAAAGEALQVTYYLMPKSFGTFTAVVRGARDKKEVTRRTLHREELQSMPGSFGDPLRVVLDLPGMARTPYSIGGLIVRGAAAYDTGTYFDGVQLPLIFHFGGGPSVVNPEFVDRMDFYPGGFGARYGRAIGGTLDIASRPASGPQVHGSAKIDLIDTGAYVAIPLSDSLTLSLAARRSYVDLTLGSVLKATSSAVVITPSYYDYQARLNYHAKKSPHAYEFLVMGSDDLLDSLARPSSGPGFKVNAHQGFQRVSASWLYNPGEALRLKTLVYFGFNQFSTGIGTAQIDDPGTVGGVREDAEYTLSHALTLRAGLDLQLQRQQFTISSNIGFGYRLFPGAAPNAPLQTFVAPVGQTDFGEWLELEARLPFGMKIVPSLRFDQFRAAGRTQPAYGPRLMVRQELGKNAATALKASAGLYSEQPSPQYANAIAGNDHLPLQQALQVAAGFEQRFTQTLNVDVTGFYSRRRDLAVATDAVTTQAQGMVQPLRYAGTGQGAAYGLEVFLRHELSRHVFGWLAYTLSFSRQRDALGKKWLATDYDQRHILTAIGQYKFNNGWAVGGRFRLVTGSPTTPVQAATYSGDTQQYTATYGDRNSSRQSTFHQLDVRVDKVWLFKTWQIGAYLDVQNIYDRKNADFKQFDYRYRTARTIPDVPILPTLGVKGVF